VRSAYAGRRIVALQSWHGNSRGPVIAFLSAFKDRLTEINFDCAGVGAYFATDFDRFGFMNINGINVGEATAFPDRFRNLKAQLLSEFARTLPEWPGVGTRRRAHHHVDSL
jgi:hypothetical protein